MTLRAFVSSWHPWVFQQPARGSYAAATRKVAPQALRMGTLATRLRHATHRVWGNLPQRCCQRFVDPRNLIHSTTYGRSKVGDDGITIAAFQAQLGHGRTEVRGSIVSNSLNKARERSS